MTTAHNFRAACIPLLAGLGLTLALVPQVSAQAVQTTLRKTIRIGEVNVVNYEYLKLNFSNASRRKASASLKIFKIGAPVPIGEILCSGVLPG